jgi:hypothetical protein
MDALQSACMLRNECFACAPAKFKSKCYKHIIAEKKDFCQCCAHPFASPGQMFLIGSLSLILRQFTTTAPNGALEDICLEMPEMKDLSHFKVLECP